MIKRTTNTKRNIIISVIAIAIIIIAIFIFNNQNQEPEQQKIENSKNTGKLIDQSNEFLSILKTDHVLGKKDAPVTIIEYASMSCPHCAEFYANGFDNLKDYIDSGEVLFIYRDLPLNGPALAGAVAAECYYNKIQQDYKYHNFVKNLFKHQEKWAFMPDFIDKLKEISVIQGISDAELSKCLEDKDLQKSIISRAQNASKSLNIKATPTFIVNGEIVSGYKGWDILAEVINRKLDMQ
ncbi:DsbA family protein [Rickettsiales bacterium]|nr:DsbA family protein [Rickettsiales bacterium]MDB2550682.1 DsbA family protein [Rickettsiales bacterium]